jgi:hypothetical protein
MLSAVLGSDHLRKREAWHLAGNAREDGSDAARAPNDDKSQKHSGNTLGGCGQALRGLGMARANSQRARRVFEPQETAHQGV